MTQFEKGVAQAEKMGLKVVENFHFSCPKIRGLIRGKVILISSSVVTDAEKVSVLFEEMAHYQTNAGDITDQRVSNNRRQELKAHRKMVRDNLPLERIVKAIVSLGIDTNACEVAAELGVTEGFLKEAFDVYREEYGAHTKVGGYDVFFEPFRLWKFDCHIGE